MKRFALALFSIVALPVLVHAEEDLSSEVVASVEQLGVEDEVTPCVERLDASDDVDGTFEWEQFQREVEPCDDLS